MNPNMDIEIQRELSLGDWVWISGVLFFVALMCFCIVLLAHGTKQSAMTQAQSVLSTSSGASLQPRSESNREAHAESVTAVTLPERPIKSSSEVLSPPTQPTLSRDAMDELAITNPRSAKAIRGNQTNSAVMRRASYRRSAVDKSVLRSVKKLIKMVSSNLGRVRMALNESQ
jgi:hypothetical protein